MHKLKSTIERENKTGSLKRPSLFSNIRKKISSIGYGNKLLIAGCLATAICLLPTKKANAENGVSLDSGTSVSSLSNLQPGLLNNLKSKIERGGKITIPLGGALTSEALVIFKRMKYSVNYGENYSDTIQPDSQITIQDGKVVASDDESKVRFTFKKRPAQNDHTVSKEDDTIQVGGPIHSQAHITKTVATTQRQSHVVTQIKPSSDGHQVVKQARLGSDGSQIEHSYKAPKQKSLKETFMTDPRLSSKQKGKIKTLSNDQLKKLELCFISKMNASDFMGNTTVSTSDSKKIVIISKRLRGKDFLMGVLHSGKLIRIPLSANSKIEKVGFFKTKPPPLQKPIQVEKGKTRRLVPDKESKPKPDLESGSEEKQILITPSRLRFSHILNNKKRADRAGATEQGFKRITTQISEHQNAKEVVFLHQTPIPNPLQNQVAGAIAKNEKGKEKKLIIDIGTIESHDDTEKIGGYREIEKDEYEKICNNQKNRKIPKQYKKGCFVINDGNKDITLTYSRELNESDVVIILGKQDRYLDKQTGNSYGKVIDPFGKITYFLSKKIKKGLSWYSTISGKIIQGFSGNDDKSYNAFEVEVEVPLGQFKDKSFKLRTLTRGSYSTQDGGKTALGSGLKVVNNFGKKSVKKIDPNEKKAMGVQIGKELPDHVKIVGENRSINPLGPKTSSEVLVSLVHEDEKTTIVPSVGTNVPVHLPAMNGNVGINASPDSLSFTADALSRQTIGNTTFTEYGSITSSGNWSGIGMISAENGVAIQVHTNSTTGFLSMIFTGGGSITFPAVGSCENLGGGKEQCKLYGIQLYKWFFNKMCGTSSSLDIIGPIDGMLHKKISNPGHSIKLGGTKYGTKMGYCNGTLGLENGTIQSATILPEDLLELDKVVVKLRILEASGISVYYDDDFNDWITGSSERLKQLNSYLDQLIKYSIQNAKNYIQNLPESEYDKFTRKYYSENKLSVSEFIEIIKSKINDKDASTFPQVVIPATRYTFQKGKDFHNIVLSYGNFSYDYDSVKGDLRLNLKNSSLPDFKSLKANTAAHDIITGEFPPNIRKFAKQKDNRFISDNPEESARQTGFSNIMTIIKKYYDGKDIEGTAIYNRNFSDIQKGFSGFIRSFLSHIGAGPGFNKDLSTFDFTTPLLESFSKMRHLHMTGESFTEILKSGYINIIPEFKSSRKRMTEAAEWFFQILRNKKIFDQHRSGVYGTYNFYETPTYESPDNKREYGYSFGDYDVNTDELIAKKAEFEQIQEELADVTQKFKEMQSKFSDLKLLKTEKDQRIYLDKKSQTQIILQNNGVIIIGNQRYQAFKRVGNKLARGEQYNTCLNSSKRNKRIIKEFENQILNVTINGFMDNPGKKLLDLKGKMTPAVRARLEKLIKQINNPKSKIDVENYRELRSDKYAYNYLFLQYMFGNKRVKNLTKEYESLIKKGESILDGISDEFEGEMKYNDTYKAIQSMTNGLNNQYERNVVFKDRAGYRQFRELVFEYSDENFQTYTYEEKYKIQIRKTNGNVLFFNIKSGVLIGEYEIRALGGALGKDIDKFKTKIPEHEDLLLKLEDQISDEGNTVGQGAITNTTRQSLKTLGIRRVVPEVRSWDQGNTRRHSIQTPQINRVVPEVRSWH